VAVTVLRITNIHIQIRGPRFIQDDEPDATGGERQVSVAGRGSARDLLQTRISRARYHYCAASDELDSTKELAKISFQPRRPANGGTTPAPVVTPVPTPAPAPTPTQPTP
jgi:hypothetical protein